MKKCKCGSVVKFANETICEDCYTARILKTIYLIGEVQKPKAIRCAPVKNHRINKKKLKD